MWGTTGECAWMLLPGSPAESKCGDDMCVLAKANKEWHVNLQLKLEAIQ